MSRPFSIVIQRRLVLFRRAAWTFGPSIKSTPAFEVGGFDLPSHVIHMCRSPWVFFRDKRLVYSTSPDSIDMPMGDLRCPLHSIPVLHDIRFITQSSAKSSSGSASASSIKPSSSSVPLSSGTARVDDGCGGIGRAASALAVSLATASQASIQSA